MDIAQTIALTMGVAWASGINLYAAILMLGVMGTTGNLALPADLEILSDPMVIGAAAFMYIVEFFTDKVPGVDTGWDSISTFIRIPAGAVLAAGAIGDVGPAAQLAAAIAGGTLTAGTHATKAGTRVMINTSPELVHASSEGVMNWLCIAERVPAKPATRPAKAPLALTRFQNRPRRNTAVIGGAR